MSKIDSDDELWGPVTSQELQLQMEAAAGVEASMSPSALNASQLSGDDLSRSARGSGVQAGQTGRTRQIGRLETPSTQLRKPSNMEAGSSVPATRSRGTSLVLQAGYDTDSADTDEVEDMVATDTESSLSPGASFNFSQLSSRTSSMTSDGSSSPSESRTSRKRTLEYSDSFASGSTPLTPSPKSRKRTQEDSVRSRQSTVQPEPRLVFLLPPTSADLVSSPQPSPTKTSIGANHTPPPARSEGTMSFHRTNSAASVTPSRESCSCTPTKPTMTASSWKAPSFNLDIPTAPSSVVSGKSHDSRRASSSSRAGVIIVAHSKAIQKLMDDEEIAWGVQYELARGVSQGLWSWGDVTASKLEELKGSNAETAHRVSQVILTRSSTANSVEADVHLWRELDREELAIIENRSRGLGLQGEWDEKANWFGGKIQQVASLVEMEKGSSTPYALHLEKMRMRKSTRFARFLGSRRMLQVNISQRYHDLQRVRDFLCQRFVICGRIFVPFCSKEGKAYLMEVDEDYERKPNRDGDQYRISLEKFLTWHNDAMSNSQQPTTKWITRFELGLSTSIPAIRFQANGDIIHIEDQVAPFDRSLGKAPTENIFTDGCGFMNGAALVQIAKHLGFSERPTALQGRIGGAKGVWLLHPLDQDPDSAPRIWIRESQRKIKHDKLSPAQLIFDLVAPPRVVIPSRLNKYAVMNLAHNGVPTEVFETLMKDGLQEIMNSLMDWSGKEAMRLLWDTVYKLGRVFGIRLQRLSSGSSRALGFSSRFGNLDDREDEPDYANDELDDSPEAATTGDPYSGVPDSRHEKVVKLLQAGFHPIQLPMLFDDLKQVISFRIVEYLQEYHIAVPQSAEAFIVPDPYGILEEGQIHFKSSQNLKDALEDKHPNILLGDVLLYRNPVRVPSDIQKVMAVSCPELSEYVDVIVLPTKGARSLASMLAGGDFDGDTGVCIFDPRLVQHFKIPSLTSAPADFLSDNFESQGTIESVGQLMTRLQALNSAKRQLELQRALLTGISDKKVGMYSKFHEIAAYKLGYDHQDTIRNAFMFTTVLDSSKTGLKPKDEVYRKDKLQFDYPFPECLQPSNDQTMDCNNPVERRSDLPPFVLDQLLIAGRRLRDEHMMAYDNLRQTHNIDKFGKEDRDLLKPLRNAESLADELKRCGCNVYSQELKLIRHHVEAHYKSWQRACFSSGRSSSFSSPSKSSTSKRSMPKKSAKDLQQVTKSFAEGPHALPFFSRNGNLDEIKASCAYATNERFAFTVAFHALCTIKAHAVGSSPVTQEFMDIMTMPASATRLLAQQRST